MSEEKVLRVSQLDAAELDDELLSVLQNHLSAVFKILPVTSHLQLRPELNAGLAAFIWWYSVRLSGHTFGQRMMDLQYSTNPNTAIGLKSRHKWTLFLLTVCIKWLRDRAHVISTSGISSGGDSITQRTVNYVTAVISALSIINFSVFLLGGKCPTLSDRVGGVFMIPTRPQVLRSLSFHLMNREILWHGFSEFLFFILPHINIFSLRNWFRRVLVPSSSLPPSSSPLTPSTSHCAFCGDLATMTETAVCGHVYCYYCLHANSIADTNFSCPLCSRCIAVGQ